MADYNKHTDEQLAKLLRSGDRMAYTEIYHRYKRLLYLFAFKRLGEKEEVWDIVHEVFLSLWINHKELQLTYSLSTYLHTVVRNKVANIITRKQISNRYLDSFKDYLDLKGYSSTDHLVRHKELEELIRIEIDALPIKMRQVFELSRKTDLSRKEIADQLGLSEETVKSHMHQALKKLRLRLGSMFSIVIFL